MGYVLSAHENFRRHHVPILRQHPTFVGVSLSTSGSLATALRRKLRRLCSVEELLDPCAGIVRRRRFSVLPADAEARRSARGTHRLITTTYHCKSCVSFSASRMASSRRSPSRQSQILARCYAASLRTSSSGRGRSELAFTSIHPSAARFLIWLATSFSDRGGRRRRFHCITRRSTSNSDG